MNAFLAGALSFPIPYLKGTRRTVSARWHGTLSRTASTAITIRTTPARRTTASLLAQRIDSIDEMEHDIATQRIVFRIADFRIAYASRQIGLLLQDVVDLDAHSRRIVFQEILRDLRVPNERRVSVPIRIARIEVVVGIRGDGEIPRQIDVGISAERVVIGLTVTVLLDPIVGTLVSHRSIRREVERLQPIVEHQLIAER